MDAFLSMLRSSPAAVEKAAQADLSALGDKILKQSQAQTPVMSGALRASGRVSVEVQKGVISVRLMFGGPAAPYAWTVHERTEVHHPTGNSKFLESPVKEATPEALQTMAGSVGRAMKGGR